MGGCVHQDTNLSASVAHAVGAVSRSAAEHCMTTSVLAFTRATRWITRADYSNETFAREHTEGAAFERSQSVALCPRCHRELALEE